MTSDIELAWLGWARRLALVNSHTTQCVKQQSTLQQKAPDRWAQIVRPGLRWPGYLGEGYEIGGVLSVGIAHTDFNTAGMAASPDVSAAIEANTTWADGNCSDSVWLAAMRAMYRNGLTWPGGWRVAKHHDFFWRNLGESAATIAYVNAMRCQWPGSGPPAKHVDACIRQLPLADLVTVLRPRLVISNSRPAFAELGPIVPTLYVHQLNGRNLEEVRFQGSAGEVTVECAGREETVQRLREAGLAR